MKSLIVIVAIVLGVTVLLWYVGVWPKAGETPAAESPQSQSEEFSNDIDTDQPESDGNTNPVETFQGTLPAADGPGIKTTLAILLGNDGVGSFTLTETYLEATASGDATYTTTGTITEKLGLIAADPQVSVFVLTTPGDQSFTTRYFEIIDADTIRALSPDATRITSDLPYNLELLPENGATPSAATADGAQLPGDPVSGTDVTAAPTVRSADQPVGNTVPTDATY